MFVSAPAVMGAVINPDQPMPTVEIEIIVKSTSIPFAEDATQKIVAAAREAVCNTTQDWNGAGWGISVGLDSIQPQYLIRAGIIGQAKRHDA